MTSILDYLKANPIQDTTNQVPVKTGGSTTAPTVAAAPFNFATVPNVSARPGTDPTINPLHPLQQAPAPYVAPNPTTQFAVNAPAPVAPTVNPTQVQLGQPMYPSQATGQDISDTSSYNTDPNSNINSNYTVTPAVGTAAVTPNPTADSINAANGQPSNYVAPTSDNIIQQYQTDRLLGRGLFAYNPNVSADQNNANFQAADQFYSNQINTLAKQEYYGSVYGIGPDGQITGTTNPYYNSGDTFSPTTNSNQATVLRSLQTGTIPSWMKGLSSEAMSSAVDSLWQDMGLPGTYNPAVAKNINASTAATLTQQTKQAANITNALQTADTNFQSLVGQFQNAGIDTSSSQFANMTVNQATQLFGSKGIDQLNAFKAGLADVSSDYATVFNKGQPVTVNAQNKSADIFGPDTPMSSLVAIEKQMHQFGQEQETVRTNMINSLMQGPNATTGGGNAISNAVASNNTTSSGGSGWASLGD
jgi:hypothetical protein